MIQKPLSSIFIGEGGFFSSVQNAICGIKHRNAAAICQNLPMDLPKWQLRSWMAEFGGIAT
ncbi:hypothetical protein [Janthinobacterium sp. GW458P]|uniref:hypothetical protein n=1 Tax=Janthinobacterium sp. GW458P TaxID=1981504 RepID=UPI00111E9066|nr:hypothetical protein [Janthinobacterium sp. GW458P]MBE3025721.1 hypothetical protein [Janthinobacterium sp. GW458P]